MRTPADHAARPVAPPSGAARLVGAGLLVGALAAPAVARAHEPDAYGVGSRSTAMGGAVSADATDFSAGYYNPAGLVGAPGVEVAIGYMYAWNFLRVDGEDTNVDSVHGLAIGIVAPGEVLGVPFAFGLTVHLPDDGLSRVTALRQEVPRWELYDHRNAILYLATNLAIRPVPWLEIGGGATFLAATRGRFEISGQANLIDPNASQLRHEVDADLSTVRYPQAGLRVLLGDLGAVALVYRGQTKLSLELDATLRGNIDFAGLQIPLVYQLESRTLDAFLPQQFVAGVSIRKVPGLSANLDLAFVNWSSYESPTARTSASLDVELPEGVPIDLPGDLRPTQIIPPTFRDRLVPRVGVEYIVPAGGPGRPPLPTPDFAGRPRRMVEVPLRAGYVFESTPVPAQTGFTNFIDTDRHTISFGAGLSLNAPHEVFPGSAHLDVHGTVSILPSRTIEKQSPADFVGDYEVDGTMASFGSTLRLDF